VERRKDVLVYSTPPLDQDTEVTGPVTLDLYAKSSAVDTDFTAKLGGCRPGRFRAESDRGHSPRSLSRIHQRRQPDRSGASLRVQDRSMVDKQRVFKEGQHKIRPRASFGFGVSVSQSSSSNFPRFDRNLEHRSGKKRSSPRKGLCWSKAR
jgi:predicted acyl esterase